MFDYKKIIVIGCSGSGKTTFSRQLHDIIGIPVFHLDYYNFNDYGSSIDREDFIKIQNNIMSSENWIIDGNYFGTLELRISRADLVFFFDMPTDLCVKGAVERTHRFELRCDLPVNDELISFINGFNVKVKPKILCLLNTYKPKIVVFNSYEQVDDFLETLKYNNELWECTGGSALAGEDSLHAAIREANEELEIKLDSKNASFYKRIKRDKHPDFCDVWIF